MKKKLNFLKIVLLIIIALVSFACEDININFSGKDDDIVNGGETGGETGGEIITGETEIVIYSINDFHGTLLETQSNVGISKIGNYLMEEKSTNPDGTLIISAGDMFQGTAVSSMSRGEAVVDTMNKIGFDAMALGNHEFDWGVKEIEKFVDGNLENGEAEFPLLAANIKDKRTGELVKWAKPYTIVQKGHIKVGIIGVIGSDQESDILKTHIENYDFTSELPAIKNSAYELRTEHDCDIVIVSAHNDTSKFNNSLASLSGDYRIDAVFNGHTHQTYVDEKTTDRNGYASMPIIQTGSYGYNLGKVTIKIDNKTKVTLESSAINLSTREVCLSSNQEIDNILLKYQDYIDLANSVLGKSGVNLYKDQGGVWACNVLRDSTDSDLGVCNQGGIRGNGFPIYSGNNVTYGDIFEMMPFENVICTVKLTGTDVKRLLNYGVYLSDNVDKENQTINGQEIINNHYYEVATIDFIFVKDSYPFIYGIDGIMTDVLFRDALVNDVLENVKRNGAFKPFN